MKNLKDFWLLMVLSGKASTEEVPEKYKETVETEIAKAIKEETDE